MAPHVGYLLPTRERVMEGRPQTGPLLDLAERAEELGLTSAEGLPHGTIDAVFVDNGSGASEEVLAAACDERCRGPRGCHTRATSGLLAWSSGYGPPCRVSALRPEPAALDSIRRGLDRLNKGMGGTDDELRVWLKALTGT